jgi:hypothetical protein
MGKLDVRRHSSKFELLRRKTPPQTAKSAKSASKNITFLCKTKPISRVFGPKTTIRRKNKANSKPIKANSNPIFTRRRRANPILWPPASTPNRKTRKKSPQLYVGGNPAYRASSAKPHRVKRRLWLPRSVSLLFHAGVSSRSSRGRAQNSVAGILRRRQLRL